MSDITYEKHGAVRLITINRADKMNSLTFEANDDLVAAWHEFDNDESARAAVITGAGDKSFCAGADLVALSRGGDGRLCSLSFEGVDGETC